MLRVGHATEEFVTSVCRDLTETVHAFGEDDRAR